MPHVTSSTFTCGRPDVKCDNRPSRSSEYHSAFQRSFIGHGRCTKISSSFVFLQLSLSIASSSPRSLPLFSSPGIHIARFCLTKLLYAASLRASSAVIKVDLCPSGCKFMIRSRFHETSRMGPQQWPQSQRYSRHHDTMAERRGRCSRVSLQRLVCLVLR